MINYLKYSLSSDPCHQTINRLIAAKLKNRLRLRLRLLNQHHFKIKMVLYIAIFYIQV